MYLFSCSRCCCSSGRQSGRVTSAVSLSRFFILHAFNFLTTCSRLDRFVLRCCVRACALLQFIIPNMSQYVATGWPKARNILSPTMLQNAALKSCDCLAGACKRLTNNVAIYCVETVMFSNKFYFLLVGKCRGVP